MGGDLADLVLRGGIVRTLDAASTTTDAVAVRHGRIVALGASAEALIGADTHVIDLDGRAVIPGINDGHVHACWLGAIWPQTFFPDEPGPSVFPTGDPHGAPEEVPPLAVSRDERKAAIRRAGAVIASFGITSYTEPGIGPGEDDGPTGCFAQDTFDAYVELEAERALTARVNVLALFGLLDGPSRLHEYVPGVRALAASRETVRPHWLRIAGVKVFADGIPPMAQAWTRHSYPDGSQGGLLVHGATIDEQATALTEMIDVAHRSGLQVGVHATGDRTIEHVIDAVADASSRVPADLRHYVIHGDLATPEQMKRLAENGMSVSMQPAIGVLTRGAVAHMLGASAADGAWALSDAAEAGVLALSSDAPILTPDWRRGAAAADALMGPTSDAAARMDALLRAYTVAGARQDGALDWKGTIEVGKVADLVVLGADPHSVVPAELPRVSIDLTIVDGEVVFARE